MDEQNHTAKQQKVHQEKRVKEKAERYLAQKKVDAEKAAATESTMGNSI